MAIPLQRLTAYAGRTQRQTAYLRLLKGFSVAEANAFFRIYNEAALNRGVSPRLLRSVSGVQAGPAALNLINHFVGLFEIWARGSKADDAAMAQSVFPVLEDLNIAALAYRKGISLIEAGQMNHRLKYRQKQLFKTSLN